MLDWRPDVVVAVADATNLARSLYLPLQLLDLGYRVVVALNLSDEARRRGRMPDAEVLSRDLGVPVVPTVAPRGEGLADLEAAVLRVVAGGGLGETAGTPLPPDVEQRVEEVALHIAARSDDGLHAPGGLGARAAALAVLEGDDDVDRAPSASTRAASSPTPTRASRSRSPRRGTRRRGRWRRRPRTPAPPPTAGGGSPPRRAPASRSCSASSPPCSPRSSSSATCSRGRSPRSGRRGSLRLVTDVVTAIFGDGTLGRVVLWGVDGGILATLAVGIPYILTFYFILALVEDTGYMNAAAFLSDRVMHRIGLHGRAIIPLIAAGGCNVPAIIATRSLGNKRERTIAAVLATLTPCSARTAVIIGAVAGVAGWQYALLTYAVLIVVIILAGLGMNRLMPGDKGVLVMEMFPFRRPVLRQVARKTWRRFREFVWDAAPIILLGSMALGLLYETGWVWELGTVLEPIVEGWLLLPMVAGLTLVFAVLRKELALQLLLVFAAVQAGGAVVSISSFMTTSQIVTYAIVNALYIPCVATIAVLGRELGWRRTALICTGTIVLALLVGGIVARVLPLFA